MIVRSRVASNRQFDRIDSDGRDRLLWAAVRIQPNNVQQIGNELAIRWNDGTESYFNLEFLRRACPCAACGGEPDVLGNVSRPRVSYTGQSFQLAGFDFVGGYAVQPRWADGHSSGIYSFTYLRRLGEASG